MKEAIVGIIGLLAGCSMTIFHKSFARLTIERQNKFWGFHFGQREIKITEVVSVIVGMGFIVLGFLFLFRIIRFK